MKRVGFEAPIDIDQIVTPAEINDIVRLIREIYMDEKLKD